MTRRFALHGGTIGHLGLIASITVTRDAGFDALEIGHERLERYLATDGSPRDVRMAFAHAGIEPLSLHAGELRLPGSVDDVVRRERRYHALCATAATIGCSSLVVLPPRCSRQVSAAVCRDTTTRTLAGIGRMAGDYGIRIGLEFAGTGESSIRTLAEAREIVQEADHSVGLVMDTFHLHAGGSTWAMMDGLDPALICHVRLTDAELRPLKELREMHRALPGDGVFPFSDFLERLESVGYDGMYSILLSRPDYRQWEPRRLARVSLESMEAACAEKDELAGALDYV